MWTKFILLFVLAGGLAVGQVQAQIIRDSGDWDVDPPFAKHDPKLRKSVSGAACVARTGHCLVALDEGISARFFRIDGRTLEPGKFIKLLPEGIGVKDELDAEAVAWAPPLSADVPGYFYVLGSHGVSRGNGEFRHAAYQLVRFPVDPATGKPTFKFDEDKLALEVKHTDGLMEILGSLPHVGPFHRQPLGGCGITAEGLAVRSGRVLVGLRAPSLGGMAYIIDVGVGHLFGSASADAKVHSLPLGLGVGIRDLAPVANGLLVLAGPSLGSPEDYGTPVGACQRPSSEPSPSIWYWQGEDRKATSLGAIPGLEPGQKPEGLTVLEETETAWRVLVLLDSKKDGKPAEYLVPKP